MGTVELLILVAVIAFGSILAVRVFAHSVREKYDCAAQGVEAMSPIACGSTSLLPQEPPSNGSLLAFDGWDSDGFSGRRSRSSGSSRRGGGSSRSSSPKTRQPPSWDPRSSRDEPGGGRGTVDDLFTDPQWRDEGGSSEEYHGHTRSTGRGREAPVNHIPASRMPSAQAVNEGLVEACVTLARGGHASRTEEAEWAISLNLTSTGRLVPSFPYTDHRFTDVAPRSRKGETVAVTHVHLPGTQSTFSNYPREEGEVYGRGDVSACYDMDIVLGLCAPNGKVYKLTPAMADPLVNTGIRMQGEEIGSWR